MRHELTHQLEPGDVAAPADAVIETHFFTTILSRSYDSRARAVEPQFFTTILLKSYDSRARPVEAHFFTTIL